MSLAAHALGLGTFWITQTGGAEEVREVVGLPYDRMVIAVLALGHPKVTPRRDRSGGPWIRSPTATTTRGGRSLLHCPTTASTSSRRTSARF